MKNYIANNLYGILGLLPDAAEKEFNKRIKDISKYLKINEVHLYDYDFEYFNKLRTLENLNLVKIILTDPKIKAQHFFYSIYLSSEDEIKDINIVNKNFSMVNILKYYKKYEKNNLCKKNTAILLYLYMLTSGKIRETINGKTYNILQLCINLWKNVFENDKIYQNFKTIYSMNDVLGIDITFLDEIKTEISSNLAIAFSELSNELKNTKIMETFIENFNISNTDSISQIEDCYRNIDMVIQKLEKLKISEDGIFDDSEKQLLSSCIKNIEDNLNQLDSYGIYENNDVIILRDRIADSLTHQALDLHNNLELKEVSLNLFNIALKICGTPTSKLNIEQQIKIIKNNIEQEKILKPIMDIVKEAQDNINKFSTKKLNKLINEVYNCLSDLKKNNYIGDIVIILRSIAIKMHNDVGKYNEALQLLNCAYNISLDSEQKNQLAQDIEVIKDVQWHNSWEYGCLMKIINTVIFWGINLVIGFICSLFS